MIQKIGKTNNPKMFVTKKKQRV